MLKDRESLEALKWKLGIGENQVCVVRNNEGIIAINMDKIAKVAEEFYIDLYGSHGSLDDDNGRGGSPDEFYIPPVTRKEVKKALEAMRKGKASGGRQVTADL